MQSDLSQKKSTHKNVIIVGAGLAGLGVLAYMIKQALSELKEDKTLSFSFVIMDKREFIFERRQKIINHPSPIIPGLIVGKRVDEIAKELFDPDNQLFFDKKNEIIGRASEEHLTKSEKFIRKTQRAPTGPKDFPNFSIKDAQARFYDYITSISHPKIHVDWLPTSTLCAIDLKNKSLTIVQNNQTTSKIFTDIILAEGTNREVLNAYVNDALIDLGEIPFLYENIDFPYPYHAAIRLKLKPLADLGNYENYQAFFDEAQVGSDVNLKQLTESKLQALGGNQIPPAVFDTNFNANSKIWNKPRYFIASAIPESLFIPKNASDPERREKKKKLIEWAKTLASYRYNLPMDAFEADDQELVTTFSMEKLHFINNPMRTLSNQSRIFVIGDEATSSIYLFGNSLKGIMNAIEQLSLCLISPKNEDDEKFLSFIRFHHLFSEHQKKLILERFGKLKIENPHKNKSIELLNAIFKEPIEKIETLLKQGADPNINDVGDTPLLNAITEKRLDIVILLLKYGANPNLNVFPSALIAAAEINHEKMINILLTYGADPVKYKDETVKRRNPENYSQINDLIQIATKIKQIKEKIRFTEFPFMLLNREKLITNLSQPDYSGGELKLNMLKTQEKFLNLFDKLFRSPVWQPFFAIPEFVQFIDAYYNKMKEEPFDEKILLEFSHQQTKEVLTFIEKRPNQERSIFASANNLTEAQNELLAFQKNIELLKLNPHI